MNHPVPLKFCALTPEGLAEVMGRIAICLPANGALGPVARKLDRLMRGQLARLAASEVFGALEAGAALDLAFPAGLQAEAVQVVKLDRRADVTTARKAGGTIGKALHKTATLVVAEGIQRSACLAFGLALRAYDFTAHKSVKDAAEAAATPGSPAPGSPPPGASPYGPVTLMVANPEQTAQEATAQAALAEGVFFTRDLVNEPANILTTLDFAARLAAMQELGLEVEILEVEDLQRLGMGALLGVAQGSDSPARVVVMRWQGGAEGVAPLALIGKGVCFDSGGISIKPAGGMEEMTMDMGGAAVVAGVMRALALRRARANVVGVVGIVENMLSGNAQRPGDIVRSMKGDTIEVINTDAEGRLVLADVLWYAQERFAPSAVIDLATLTGAIIVALGAENAGVFANDDRLAEAFLKAARAEGEGAWRMPMGPAYDAKLKSRLADMMNVGGREGGAITAAQFLQRFIKDGTPWMHLDIAGVTLAKADTPLAPKGATGWGVLALDRLIRDGFEG